MSRSVILILKNKFMENLNNKIDNVQKNEGLNLEIKRFNLSQETLNLWLWFFWITNEWNGKTGF